jgi:hypothetical protein
MIHEDLTHKVIGAALEVYLASRFIAGNAHCRTFAADYADYAELNLRNL